MFDLNQINTLSSEIAMQSLKKRKGMLFCLSCSCELLLIRASPQAAVKRLVRIVQIDELQPSDSVETEFDLVNVLNDFQQAGPVK